VSPLDLGVMFSLGLLSSLHCVQMCGPIVLSYSVALESLTGNSRRSLISPLLTNHLAYNAGRILTYCALGAVAGFAGKVVAVLGRISGFVQPLAILAGILMVLAGIFLSGILPARLQSLLRIPSSWVRRVGTLLSIPGSRNRFVLGLALGFLPCGLIYAAMMKAMATGSPVAGAASMLAFGVGTAVALLAIGISSSSLRMQVNRWGPQLAAIAFVVMGAWLIWRGSMPAMLVMEHHMHAGH
jgi:sulfite exporter TauE/SafE